MQEQEEQSVLVQSYATQALVFQATCARDTVSYTRIGRSTGVCTSLHISMPRMSCTFRPTECCTRELHNKV